MRGSLERHPPHYQSKGHIRQQSSRKGLRRNPLQRSHQGHSESRGGVHVFLWEGHYGRAQSRFIRRQTQGGWSYRIQSRGCPPHSLGRPCGRNRKDLFGGSSSRMRAQRRTISEPKFHVSSEMWKVGNASNRERSVESSFRPEEIQVET